MSATATGGQGPALAPVPEPGSWVLLMPGLALLAWRAGAFKTARIVRAGV